jgi:4,5-dihydroxyphthalate decarboxylase
MSKLSLTVALSPYEHALDLLEGRIAAEGVDLNWLRVPPTVTGDRFTQHRACDVAEISLADYVSRLAKGDRAVVAIPVFLSRQFMPGAIWARVGGPVRAIGDLRDPKISCIADDETTTVYMRHWLNQAIGLDREHRWPLVDSALLHAKLAGGEVDVGLSLNRPPSGKGEKIRRVVEDVSEAERAYYEATRVFPILRVLCIQRDLIEQHRWLAASLFEAFNRAKRNSLGRLIGAGMSRYPLPWLNAYVTQARANFGEDFWPYGVEMNRPTLAAFLQTIRDPAIGSAPFAVEDLFAESTRGS